MKIKTQNFRKILLLSGLTMVCGTMVLAASESSEETSSSDRDPYRLSLSIIDGTYQVPTLQEIEGMRPEAIRRQWQELAQAVQHVGLENRLLGDPESMDERYRFPLVECPCQDCEIFARKYERSRDPVVSAFVKSARQIHDIQKNLSQLEARIGFNIAGLVGEIDRTNKETAEGTESILAQAEGVRQEYIKERDKAMERLGVKEVEEARNADDIETFHSEKSPLLGQAHADFLEIYNKTRDELKGNLGQVERAMGSAEGQASVSATVAGDRLTAEVQLRQQQARLQKAKTTNG